jgi:putative mRNA 3-end processing factor
MSEPTRRLLVAEFNAELPYRDNIVVVDMNRPCAIEDNEVLLQRSGHMLGSVQVSVQLPNGTRLGYSGDFQWPLDDVIEVDALVIDSTYGSPARRREYSQAEAESRFLELVLRQLKRGPVHVTAHRGTLQRSLQILAGQVDCPLLGSPRLCAEVEVYREHGYGVAEIIQVNTAPGKAALKADKFIRVHGTGDQFPVDIGNATTINLSAYMSRPDDPVMEYSESSFQVALSNHADFPGTIEYVRATGAKYVVTDNTRGGHAAELAIELTRLLGVTARPSTVTWSREWGL